LTVSELSRSRISGEASLSTTLWVLGNSGLAREVEALAMALPGAAPRWERVVRLDRDDEDQLRREGGDAVLGIGDPRTRKLVAERFAPLGDVCWPLLCHPRADVGSRVELGEGVVVASGAIITVDVEISPWSMVNYGVTVGHDSRIGRYCQVNPQASISGNVVLGEGVLVGTGANILEGRHIGEGAIVGAGAVVVKDVEPFSTVVGVPARPRG
jgi:sugar O-acyltransferase (sialic acid O-acetyltransferase NeuD family)